MISGQAINPPEKKFRLHMSEPKQAPNGDASDAPVGAKAVAEYSADILTELRDLATGAGLTFLAYLIQVAFEEAKIQAAEPEDK